MANCPYCHESMSDWQLPSHTLQCGRPTGKPISIDKKEPVEYLGDGLYVRFRGCDYEIFASNGTIESNHVYLELSAVMVLNRFVERTQKRTGE